MGLFSLVRRIPKLPMFWDYQSRLSQFKELAEEDPQRPDEALAEWAVRVKARVCDELGLPKEKYVREWVTCFGQPERAYQLLPSTSYLQAHLAQSMRQFGQTDARTKNTAALLETAQNLVAEIAHRLNSTDVNDLRTRRIIP